MKGIPPGNHLIERLPHEEQVRLVDACRTVDLVFDDVLCDSNEALRFAWFPLTGVIGGEAEVDDHPPMEMGLSGNEGMFGETLVIGVDTAPFRAVVRSPGTALRIAASDFARLVAECPVLKSTVQRYLYVTTIQRPHGPRRASAFMASGNVSQPCCC